MDIARKGEIIGLILGELSLAAFAEGKHHDEGDVFFSLCFKSDPELLRIAHLCGISR